ncbi:MAG: DUF262 domain-containing protein [bacterium]|nr:DUF262 domain-containing protein [bacterium]
MFAPKYDELFNPLLKALHELGGSSSLKTIEGKVASILNLTPEETADIHRGNTTKLEYRLSWASNYLKRYGLIDKSKRGIWSLTEEGRKVNEVDKDEVNRIVKAFDLEKSNRRLIKKGFDRVDMKVFLENTNLDSFKYEPHFLSNPGVRVKDILANVEKRWVLPNFQRYYDWDKEDVRAFLESIFNDYFVGSLLLWEVEGDPGIAFFPIEGVKSTIPKPEVIILDGQQRITSLYYAIKNPILDEDKIKSFFYVSFKNYFESSSADVVVVSNRRLSIRESVESLLFPFYELEQHIDWIREFEDFYETQEGIDKRKLKELTRIMHDRVRHVWENFQIPEIKLPASMKLHHVVDIFENINTKGKLLDAFDLLIAASSKHNIDLRKLWEESCQKYPNLSKYAAKTKNKLRMYILQSISLLHNPTSSCKKSDILDLYEQVYSKKGKDPKMFEQHWEEMSKYVDLAIQELEDLKDGFGIIDEEHVPFMPVIPILAALKKEVDSRSNKHSCNAKIKQWYWSVVFSEAYSSAVDSQLTLDFKELKDWFSDDTEIPKSVAEARAIVQALNLRRVSTLSSAIYKGILSLLAIKGSRDLQTGEMVNNRNDYHKDHVFPKSKADNYVSTKKDIDSILNMVWLTKSTNQNKGAKDPKKYFGEFESRYSGNRGAYIDVLQTHYINKIAYDAILDNDFEGFINERESLISAEIKEKIGWTEVDKSYDNQDDIDQLIQSFENERLEFKSTFKKNLETQKADETMRFSVLKTIAGFLNAQGGTLIIGYNEKEKSVVGLEQDYQLMKMGDRDSFELEFWSYVESNIDKEIIKNNVDLEFEIVDGKELAVVKIRRSTKPIYLQKNNKKILYVRNRNETENLEDPEEIHNYIEKHF